MPRIVLACCLLSLLIQSVGCRMCCTPHDYRLTGYVDRPDDYRGFDPMYRAGSILGSDADQMVIGDAYYRGSTGDYYANAGNYGTTTPVSAVYRTPIQVETIQPGQGQTIGIPQQPPGNGIITQPPHDDTRVPTVDELINQRREMPLPMPQPVTPPRRPKVVVPPSIDNDASIPFSPNDEPIVPPTTVPKPSESDPPITLEELRRLDPSIQDVQIISIEDAGLESLLK